MTKKFYVDACCNRFYELGSYAIVCGEEHYTGLIHGKNLNSGYCELYGIREALYRTKNQNAIIYNDNTCVNNLNLSTEKFEKKFKKRRLKDNGLLKEVFILYNNYPNVKIDLVNRKRVRVADYLARKTLKECIKNGRS